MSARPAASTPGNFSALLLALSALALVLIAACGDDDSEAPPPATATVAAPGTPASEIAPCALVTASEAEGALGAPVTEERADVPPIVSCTYITQDELIYVQVIVYEHDAQARDGLDLAVEVNGFTPIDGLGDDAYNSQPVFDVTVLRGVYELSVDTTLGSAEEQVEQASDLARTALERLP